MAILTFPLVISFLKPHTSRFSFLRAGKPIPSRLDRPLVPRRHLTRTFVSAISTSAIQQHSSADPNKEPLRASVPSFQQAVQRLQEYWASVGCAIMQCSNTEVGAGTMNPLTFLRVLVQNHGLLRKCFMMYVEPSIRPDDSRYGENPNRLQRHTQFQVILKPDPGNSQDLFIRSLSALGGIDVSAHDIRFVEDNWESPVLGAWGLGWEIWMDGMEITQFTYFQQAGSLQLTPISVEITYGLERILMLLQGVDHFKKIQYADGITYGELFLENEKEMSAYYLERASVHHLQKHFDFFEEEARSLLASGLAIPAYDQLLKTSHAFNILDSRGFVGVTERARYFSRMRSLARQCAQLWLKTRESLGHPLGIASDPVHVGCPKELLDAAVKKVNDDSRLFILEIGTEEMPPQDVVDASQQTSRRRLRFEDLLFQKFDPQGNSTKAAEGFCRRYSIPLDSLYKRLMVLSEELPSTIANISFPKSMRWNSQIMFSRPIRWILALHGHVVVPFSFSGVLSGNLSYGLRNTPSATLMVESAESYADLMRKAGINVKIEERKKTILDHSNALAKSVNGHIHFQEGLLNEVVNLVEAPVPVLGKFDESFLELPKDLLAMVMQKHQKYFAVRDDSGRLLPYFVAVANGAIDELVVRKGNEAVLRARYEDAKFFYEMDTRKKFSDFRSQLRGILFHEKLGTMLDKIIRIDNIVVKLSFALQIDEDIHEVVQDAASLAMSDLATAVVTEFTSLSGIMARHYAIRDGYSEQVAEALFEITLPRFSGDILPETDAGIVLAVADRLDSLVGLFAAGCQPSSTNDPFGLRRISYGLVQLLVEKGKNLDLKQALELAADVQPIEVHASTIEDAHQFVTRRLEQFLVDKGISSEVVRSVLAERANLPSLAAKSAYKMEALTRGKLFPKIVEAYSRPTRIVRGKEMDPDMQIDEAAFETNEERALWSAFLSVKNKIYPGIEVDDFVEISSQLAEPLEDFFNNVFVMVEDERIRKNRLALLRDIADLPRGIADLSVLPGF
ncbi:Glycine--tRNA ligase 2, chloroplastic/mitochondrial [Morella rubra]|uniref:glycine--tRNA ligase n=1 Tax=Morella rubra TaxID=262757 RepID=A0A6A1WN24_9ROSI|nr:Glycine--tRNA ligase 2, chloroplastic/mitochondrial [Morella rubra]